MESPKRAQHRWPEIILLGGLCAAVAFSGCVSHAYHPGHHHALKASHKHKASQKHKSSRKHAHRGVERVFDAAIGVHVVAGHAHHYFHRDRYYRLRAGHWEVSADWNGRWTRIEVSALPAGLAKHARKQAKKKGKGHHPAKHR